MKQYLIFICDYHSMKGRFNFQNICQFDSYIIGDRMFSIFIHRNSHRCNIQLFR